MNILYVTSNSFLRSTTSSLHALFGAFPSADVRPVMVFRRPGPWQEELSNRGVSCYFDDVTVPALRSVGSVARSVLRFSRIIRREQIDLIHCNEHELYPLIRLVARVARVPVVVTAHFHLEATYAQWLFRDPYRPAHLQFVSQAVLDDSAAGLPAPTDSWTSVVPNALAVDDFLRRSQGWESLRASLEIPPGAVVVGTASAIRPRKRLEDFVALIHGLRSRGMSIVGLIAGGAPFSEPAYEASLRQSIQEKHLDESCRLIGNVDPLAPWLRVFDIFVSTSEIEPFGMSACEAMACGTPAVVYDAGGINHVVHAPWCVVPTRDIGELGLKVERLISDGEFRQRMGREAARHVRGHFDGPAVAPVQLDVYQRVLASYRRGVR